MVDKKEKDLGPKHAMPAADFSLLSEEDKKALREEARKSILEEMKQEARDKYFAEVRENIRRSKVPADKIVEVEVNSAPYVPFFMLDGKHFYNGYTYKVPSGVAAVLYEQMQRSWRHQDEIDGRTRAHNLSRNIRIGPRDAGTTWLSGKSVWSRYR
jgi:hypothetical protein